ncbi:hypothetical protein COOONC_04095 [Cooperia oncophora]
MEDSNQRPMTPDQRCFNRFPMARGGSQRKSSDQERELPQWATMMMDLYASCADRLEKALTTSLAKLADRIDEMNTRQNEILSRLAALEDSISGLQVSCSLDRKVFYSTIVKGSRAMRLQLIEELSKGDITARRYPPERIKSANGRDRIIKIELPSQALRDKLLHHMRSGRQSLTRRFVHSYARRDYTSEELELDRTLRKQAGMSNAKLGMLQYVVRDLRICKLKTPRELPRRYPATSQSAPRTTSGIPLGPIEASLVGTPSSVILSP